MPTVHGRRLEQVAHRESTFDTVVTELFCARLILALPWVSFLEIGCCMRQAESIETEPLCALMTLPGCKKTTVR